MVPTDAAPPVDASVGTFRRFLKRMIAPLGLLGGGGVVLGSFMRLPQPLGWVVVVCGMGSCLFAGAGWAMAAKNEETILGERERRILARICLGLAILCLLAGVVLAILSAIPSDPISPSSVPEP